MKEAGIHGNDPLIAHDQMAEVAEPREGALDDPPLPKGEPQRQAHAYTVCLDGFAWLDAIYAEGAPQWLREVPVVKTLRRVWCSNITAHQKGCGGAPRQKYCHPAARMISSPYDPEVYPDSALLARKSGECPIPATHF
jgi:hypothetical protein